MDTQTRLTNLIQVDIAAGNKVEWLEIDPTDRASLVADIRKKNTPLAKAMKTSGIDVALPTLGGVPVRWGAATTKTKLKEKTK